MNLNKLNEGCGAIEEEAPYEEAMDEEHPIEVIDQPSEMEVSEIPVEEPINDAASTLEGILGELTVDQLKAALAAKQGQ